MEKEFSEYDIDGIIVIPDAEYIRNVDKNPKYSFAFKMQLDTNVVNVEVEKVLWNISKFGLLKPRVQIKPVNLNGVTITYTTGFNAKYIVEKNIGPGAIIKLTRSGDVIPFILGVIKPSQYSELLPDNIKYKWNENNVDIVALEDFSNEAEIKLISSFFKGMGIKFVSEKTVEKLYNSGYDSLIKILEGTSEDFAKIEGFQKTLADKVYINIHEGLQDVDKADIVGCAGVFEGFGTRKVKALLEGIPDIFDTNTTNGELRNAICEIEGFSEKSADKIVESLPKVCEFLKSIDKFIKYNTMKGEKKKGLLEDLTFLFSGFRDKELEKKIESKGGKIVSSVSSKLSCLIVSDIDSSSSKVDKAEKLGVKIVSREKFEI